MTITAKFQGMLNVPLFDTGLRPTTNGVDGGSYLTSFPQANKQAITHQFRQPTINRFYEITGLAVQSPFGHTLNLNYNAGNLDPGAFDGSWQQGSIFGGNYWTMATSALSDYNGFAAFACIPWNGLFDQNLVNPIILHMGQVQFPTGIPSVRGFFAVQFYAFFGTFLTSNTLLLYNPYINNQFSPNLQMQIQNVTANANTSTINVPDFQASINYTLQVIGPAVPPTFRLTLWGFGNGDAIALSGNNQVISGIPFDVVFDDPNIASQFFGSNNRTFAWNPQGFLISSSAVSLYNNMRSIFLTKDCTKYWGINYTPPAGMLWNFAGSDSNNGAMSVDNSGIMTTNAYYNPNDSNKIYTLTSAAFSIPWNLPQFNLGPMEVALPCLSSCLGKGFALTKL